MKVQYIKKYTDDAGKTFECGWTAEHTDSEAQRRIDLGVCKEVDKNTKPRKSAIATTDCVVMDQQESKAEVAPETITFKHKKK